MPKLLGADMSTKSQGESSSEQRIEHLNNARIAGDHVAIQNETYAINEDALGTNLPKNYYWSPGFIGTIIALCMGNISNYTGYVLPSNILTYINNDLGPSPNINWVSIVYTLGLSVGFLLVGRLSDIFGRRWFFIIGNLLSLVGSIIGCTAKDVNSLIGADALMGLAGSVQISFTVAVAELVPNKTRPFAVAAIFFSSVHVAAFGPVVGESLIKHTAATWRWVYYLDCITSGLAVVLFFLFYHPPDFKLLHMNRSRKEQCQRQDIVGFVLFTGGLLVFILGISWGGTVHPWNSSYVIATIIVGFCTLVVFVLYDAYVHKGDSLLPTHLFRQPGYLAMVITAMVGSCVYYSMNVLWPQQISYLFSGSDLHKAWLACITGGSCLVGQLVGAVLCRFIKKSRWILITGCVGLVAFSASMVSIKPLQETKAVGLMFMACFWTGIVETCSLSLAPLSLPTEDIGGALGALGSIRSGGASVATAIYTTILKNKLDLFLSPAVTGAALDAGLPKSSIQALTAGISSGNFGDVPGITPSIITAVTAAEASAAARAFQYVWYAVIAFAAVALIASCLTIDYGVYMTDEVSRKINHRAEETGRPMEEMKASV